LYEHCRIQGSGAVYFVRQCHWKSASSIVGV